VDLVDLGARVVLAAAEAVLAVADVAVRAADLEVVLAAAVVRANGTILPSAFRYSTSSTTLTCRRQTGL
jgi:hypothetical protein